jgi:hypothetical protein
VNVVISVGSTLMGWREKMDVKKIKITKKSGSHLLPLKCTTGISPTPSNSCVERGRADILQSALQNNPSQPRKASRPTISNIFFILIFVVVVLKVVDGCSF